MAPQRDENGNPSKKKSKYSQTGEAGASIPSVTWGGDKNSGWQKNEKKAGPVSVLGHGII